MLCFSILIAIFHFLEKNYFIKTVANKHQLQKLTAAKQLDTIWSLVVTQGEDLPSVSP